MFILAGNFIIFLLRARLKFNQEYKYLIKSPRWLLMFIFGRFIFIRSFLSYFYKPPALEKYKNKLSLFDLNVENVVQSLKKDGLSLGINLNKNTIQEILCFAESTKFYANYDRNLVFHISDIRSMQARHNNNYIIGDYLNNAKLCPAINQLASDPKLLEIAAIYLNNEPKFVEIKLYWNFVTNAKAKDRMKLGAVLFHHDPIDYHSLKFYFYLTDVDLFSGPHVCVRGSHKNKKVAHQFSLLIGREDRDITDYYGDENVVTVCEKAGFGFAEEPFCFHKAITPSQRERLVLQITFTLNKYRAGQTEIIW